VEPRQFANRTEAGLKLAEELRYYRGRNDTIVIGLPRGGVVTAAAIAETLDLPLDVLVVRKLGTPGQEELAMGAIGPGGVRVLNEDVIRFCGIQQRDIDAVTASERNEVDRRERLFRGGEPPLNVARMNVIIVDDGLATGSTMTAAIDVLRKQRPKSIIVAVPVAPPDTAERLRTRVDEFVCLETPASFEAVGYWYVDFAQVEDGEVVRVLRNARDRKGVAV
jgi:predicted phosphoribosyltransferase